MKKLQIILFAFLLALVSITPLMANEQNQMTPLGQSLGASANPLPASMGEISSVPANHPAQQQIGGYSSQIINNSLSFQDAQRSSATAPPAWAQTNFNFKTNFYLSPFASNLFSGHFASTYSDDMNAHYLIQPGDRIVIRIWGAKIYDDVLIVDQQGNIFLPEIGPVKIAGLKQSSLASSVRSKISSVFTDNVNSYVNLQSAQPVGVYVTGFVNNPGRYAGGSRDSVLAYLDRAGGIISDRGSYRKIKIMRGKRNLANVDLYEFVLAGALPDLRLRDGDVIIVEEIEQQIIATGALRQPALYEFETNSLGQDLINLCSPNPNASHISLTGIRNGIPVNKYFSLDDFRKTPLMNGDNIVFVADKKSKSMMVAVEGAIEGASRFPVSTSTTLRELLPYVAINPNLADISSIYILRHSVAQQQKVILEDSLRQLEQSALTATSSTESEAAIRVSEATLIQDFVKRAALVEPDGVLVVYNNDKLFDTLLEDQDTIVIPQKTNVVHVTGEVMMATALLWDKKSKIQDYIENAGGYSNRANKKNILIVRMNGEVGSVNKMGIAAGDRILVLPKFATKNLEFAKSMTQILYQIAVATKVALDI